MRKAVSARMKLAPRQAEPDRSPGSALHPALPRDQQVGRVGTQSSSMTASRQRRTDRPSSRQVLDPVTRTPSAHTRVDGTTRSSPWALQNPASAQSYGAPAGL